MGMLVERPAIPVLTGLRFFLAAAVVVFHYGEQMAPQLPVPLRNLLGSGFLAVDSSCCPAS